MNRVLIIGCGDIGRRVARLLRGRARLYGLLRTPERADALRAAGIVPIAGNLDDPRTLARLAGLADVILHLAPPPATGDEDTRTRHLLAALSRRRLPSSLVYVSTSGVYGDCSGEVVPETRTPRPRNARAQRRLDAERQVRDWAARNGVRASILRAPGIYAADRLPLARLRAGIPAILAAEDSYTNHIHADDLARLLVAAMRRGALNRLYHASDDSGMKMGDYFDRVADTFQLPRPPRLPRDEVARAVPPELWSFMAESRRLDNMRIKRELHFRLLYPAVADTLAGLLR
jgi:nucleoside-diphosphate-sugar epimerase